MFPRHCTRASLLPPLLLLALFCGLACSQPEDAPPPAGEGVEEPPAPAPATMPVLQPVPNTGQLTPSTTDKFTFWAFGDNRGGSTTFGDIMIDMCNAKPAFALSSGDIIDGEPPTPVDTDAIKTEYDNYFALAKTGETPIFNAPGNHELSDSNHCPNAALNDLYASEVAPLYGAFDYGNARFIALNTVAVPTSDTCSPDDCPACAHCVSDAAVPAADRSADTVDCTDPCSAPTPWECSFMDQTQLDLLDADLAANTEKTHIFILMHYPLKPRKCGDLLIPYISCKLHDILGQYDNISFVLASHEHVFYNPQPGEHDNITSIPTWTAGTDDTYYLVSGGAGAPLGSSSHSFFHYLVFDVDGGTVNVTIEKPKGTLACT